MLATKLDCSEMKFRQLPFKSAKREHTQQETKWKRKLQLVESTYINDMLRNRLAYLLINDIDILNAEPQIPTTLPQKEKEVQKISPPLRIPVARVQPDTTFVKKDTAELLLIIDITAITKPEQIISGWQIRKANKPRVLVILSTKLVHSHININSNWSPCFQIFKNLLNAKQGFTSAQLSGNDINGHYFAAAKVSTTLIFQRRII